jgi:hypothetical protein
MAWEAGIASQKAVSARRPTCRTYARVSYRQLSGLGSVLEYQARGHKLSKKCKPKTSGTE